VDVQDAVVVHRAAFSRVGIAKGVLNKHLLFTRVAGTRTVPACRLESPLSVRWPRAAFGIVSIANR
jgi:hypothetical protein